MNYSDFLTCLHVIPNSVCTRVWIIRSACSEYRSTCLYWHKFISIGVFFLSLTFSYLKKSWTLESYNLTLFSLLPVQFLTLLSTSWNAEIPSNTHLSLPAACRAAGLGYPQNQRETTKVQKLNYSEKQMRLSPFQPWCRNTQCRWMDTLTVLFLEVAEALLVQLEAAQLLLPGEGLYRAPATSQEHQECHLSPHPWAEVTPILL